ncbi:dehydrogenase [Sphingobium sp. MI1205]|nr:dehydrogenase [Sphingobium sp. MI1205]
MEDQRFLGKVAVITGGTRGIGLATVEYLARRGARVALSSRKAEACEAVQQRLEAEGLTCLAVPGHAANDADVARLVDEAVKAFGGIDMAIANAGINPVFDPLTDVAEESWAKVMDTNVGGPRRLARHALPHIAERGGGAMVCVSSVNARFGMVGSGAYGVSKAALEQMVRQLAVEWGGQGIRINGVAPGTTGTDMIRALQDRPGFMDTILSGTPLRRIADPEDVAAVIAFMASDGARHVTGQTLVVDGGQTITRG